MISKSLLCRDIQVLKTYGAAPYAAGLKTLEKEIKEKQQSVNEKIGVKVSYDGMILDGL
jgi:26S proteasome regulatory subunit T1